VLLKDILYKVAIRSVVGSTDVDVTDVQIDSRRIVKGSLFIAVKGVNADGHKFIDKAIETGAKAIVCEIMPKKKQTDAILLKGMKKAGWRTMWATFNATS